MISTILKIARINRRVKIAFRGTVSEFDDTSSIGSVIVSYYRISIFVAIGVVVWPWQHERLEIDLTNLILNWSFNSVTRAYDRISLRNLLHYVRNAEKP